jgi:chemotaxis protein methyltransferase CheR
MTMIFFIRRVISTLGCSDAREILSAEYRAGCRQSLPSKPARRKRMAGVVRGFHSSPGWERPIPAWLKNTVDIDLQLNTTQLADTDFTFLRRLIYEKSRIHLGPDKKVLVSSRLAKRLRQLQLEDYHQYCELLRSPAGEEELRVLIDRISTNHTTFFRESKHFDFMRDTVLPQWRARPESKREPLRVWSAASSTGEEPYSLAILLAECLAPAHTNAWLIEASDISTRVLEAANQAVYETDRLAGVKQEWIHKYFQKGMREWEGHYRVKAELRERVRFHHLNLLEANYPFTTPFQVIFCRNVMIYFDRPTQESLVGYLSERLVPGGYLMVGHSESLSGVKHSLQHLQPAIYQKPGA